MKIAILGAGGVRTPLIVESMIRRQDKIGLSELALMDIDGDRLEIIGELTAPLEQSGAKFKITRTTQAREALAGADYVITTFRVGGIESRVIDERVPLELGILGQETTGPGGFAMGLRSVPVLLDYIRLMGEVCPQAWLINFANPAGMMTEAIANIAGWGRSVGICDAPSSMLRVVAAVLSAISGSKVRPEDVSFDYFGLNHLGWVRSVVYNGVDYLPQLIQMIRSAGEIPGLPFETDFIASLGMIPNEYLYYFYYNHQAVQNILRSEESRGEMIAAMNVRLFKELRQALDRGDQPGMAEKYQAYLNQRGATYMAAETGKQHEFNAILPDLASALEGEGYAGVALDVIEGLSGEYPRRMILNVPNRGAIHGMQSGDVVEIPVEVSRGSIQPLAIGEIPEYCLGLMKMVKAYEKLTVEAAVEKSYAKALMALTIHPLVLDRAAARAILDGYLGKHGAYFPRLS